MFKKVLLAFAIAVALVLGVIAMQPASYTVTRSATIAAPPEAVFRLIDDFHSWEGWSPWAKLDPAMKQTYEGPASGVGAAYKWSGNSLAGEGSMTIEESRPDSHVAIRLEFTRPYASSALIALDLRPSAGGAEVTWNMTGKNNFALKAVSLFAGMDRMVGPDFEKGLARLKARCEAAHPLQ